jgi:hypothetical protein
MAEITSIVVLSSHMTDHGERSYPQFVFTASDEPCARGAPFNTWVETVYHPRIHSPDRRGPTAAVDGRRLVLPTNPGSAGRGVSVGGTPQRDQDRHGVPARKRLPG